MIDMITTGCIVAAMAANLVLGFLGGWLAHGAARERTRPDSLVPDKLVPRDPRDDAGDETLLLPAVRRAGRQARAKRKGKR